MSIPRIKSSEMLGTASTYTSESSQAVGSVTEKLSLELSDISDDVSVAALFSASELPAAGADADLPLPLQPDSVAAARLALINRAKSCLCCFFMKISSQMVILLVFRNKYIFVFYC